MYLTLSSSFVPMFYTRTESTQHCPKHFQKHHWAIVSSPIIFFPLISSKVNNGLHLTISARRRSIWTKQRHSRLSFSDRPRQRTLSGTEEACLPSKCRRLALSIILVLPSKRVTLAGLHTVSSMVHIPPSSSLINIQDISSAQNKPVSGITPSWNSSTALHASIPISRPSFLQHFTSP